MPDPEQHRDPSTDEQGEQGEQGEQDEHAGRAHRAEARDRARARATDARTGSAAAANRIRNQHQWVDLQVQEAMRRGEFDNLPGAGKPIRNLGAQHDPDWWVRQLVEREKITGVLPPALQLRKDDAELDALVDSHSAEVEVRRVLEEFNARVLKARYTPVDGPPLITQTRDVEAEVEAWRGRRRQRDAVRRQQAAADASRPAAEQAGRRRSWWRPGSYRRGGGLR